LQDIHLVAYKLTIWQLATQRLSITICRAVHHFGIIISQFSKSKKHTLKTTLILKANLFMGIGALENVLNGFQMVSDMNILEKKLSSRKYKNLTIKSIIFPNENHETVYTTFITQGLLWAFKKQKL